MINAIKVTLEENSSECWHFATWPPVRTGAKHLISLWLSVCEHARVWVLWWLQLTVGAEAAGAQERQGHHRNISKWLTPASASGSEGDFLQERHTQDIGSIPTNESFSSLDQALLTVKCQVSKESSKQIHEKHGEERNLGHVHHPPPAAPAQAQRACEGQGDQQATSYG